MHTKIRTIIITLIAAGSFATATVAPAASQAEPSSPTTTATGCGGQSKPGDIMEVKVTTTLNGKVIGETTVKSICGSDGEWHKVVASTQPSPTKVPVAPVTAAPVLVKTAS